MGRIGLPGGIPKSLKMDEETIMKLMGNRAFLTSASAATGALQAGLGASVLNLFLPDGEVNPVTGKTEGSWDINGWMTAALGSGIGALSGHYYGGKMSAAINQFQEDMARGLADAATHPEPPSSPAGQGISVSDPSLGVKRGKPSDTQMYPDSPGREAVKPAGQSPEQVIEEYSKSGEGKLNSILDSWGDPPDTGGLVSSKIEPPPTTQAGDAARARAAEVANTVIEQVESAPKKTRAKKLKKGG